MLDNKLFGCQHPFHYLTSAAISNKTATKTTQQITEKSDLRINHISSSMEDILHRVLILEQIIDQKLKAKQTE